MYYQMNQVNKNLTSDKSCGKMFNYSRKQCDRHTNLKCSEKLMWILITFDIGFMILSNNTV